MEKMIITAVSQSILQLPTLQILVSKKNDLFVGEALDFQFIGYSKKNESKEACQEICEQICHMAVHTVIKRLENGTIDRLYENSNPLGKKWDEYISVQRQERIERIKKAYEQLKSLQGKPRKISSDQFNKQITYEKDKLKIKPLPQVA